MGGDRENIPNTLQVHGTDFDDMTDLFAFQNTVTTTASHAGDIEQFGAVDHVVVFSAGHTDAFGFNLVAKTALVLPEGGRHPGFGTGGCHLTGCIVDVSLHGSTGRVAIAWRCHGWIGDGYTISTVELGWVGGGGNSEGRGTYQEVVTIERAFDYSWKSGAAE